MLPAMPQQGDVTVRNLATMTIGVGFVLALGLPTLMPAYARTQSSFPNSAYDWEAKQSRSSSSTRTPTLRELRLDTTPEYPPTSRLRNEQGIVRVRISLDQTGRIAGMAMEHTSGFDRLDEAAMRYLQANWVYKTPNLGAPIPATVPIDVVFRFN